MSISADPSQTTSSSLNRWGLPDEIQFCKRCVISNQRPSSAIEFKNDNTKEGIFFDEEGICSACRYHDMKWGEIDWDDRHRQLVDLLDRHRRNDGRYDVIVPGSGGKDSMYVSHVLKHKYGMHPLTVTWPPHMYTDVGRRNFDAWLECGFDNITIHPNPRVHRQLTRLAFLEILHPFQPFIIGQKQVGPKTALRHDVKLIMYGESQAEGGNRLDEAFDPVMNPKYYAVPRADVRDIRIAGLDYAQLLARGLQPNDLETYLPVALEDVTQAGIEVHHMGFYEQWIPQERYYYAQENCGFVPNDQRTEGTFTRYIGIDDKMDGFNFFTKYIKFGIGRASYEASQEIRNQYLEREEGVALVHRYDGEFPQRYFADFLDYLDIDEEVFWEKIDEFRPEHLWTKENNSWKLIHQVD